MKSDSPSSVLKPPITPPLSSTSAGAAAASHVLRCRIGEVERAALPLPPRHHERRSAGAANGRGSRPRPHRRRSRRGPGSARECPRRWSCVLTNGVSHTTTLYPWARRELHHVARRREAGVVLPLVRSARTELGHVPGEVVVGDLPRRIEDEHRAGDAPLRELADDVANLAARAPHVRGHPRREHPRRRQRGPAGVAGVALQHVEEAGAAHEVERAAS